MEDFGIKYKKMQQEESILAAWFKKWWLPLIVSIALIIIASFLWVKCSPDKVVPVIQNNTKDVVKNTYNREADLQRQLDSTNRHDSILIKRGNSFEQKFYASQEKLKEAIARERKGKDTSVPGQLVDTSMAKKKEQESDYTNDIIDAATTNNENAVNVITNLHEQVANRDSALIKEAEKTITMKAGFDNLVSNELIKDAVIAKLNKQLKWRNVKDVGLFAAIVFLAIKVIAK